MTVDEIEKEYYLNNIPLPEYLVEMAEIGENIGDIDSVGDIQAGFPSEDCLSGPIESLKHILKYTHKNNKLLPDLKAILEALEEKQSELTRNAEYGIDELKKLSEKLGL